MTKLKSVLILLLMFFICCQKDEMVPIEHISIDSTVYILNNNTSSDINITVWNKAFQKSVFSFEMKPKENFVFSEYDISTYPQYLTTTDSCEFIYNDKTKINFYPMIDFSWDNLPITPQNHNDSLLMHYPFRQSNCKITIADTDNGKQRIFCQYTITEDDYNFAKNYGKMTKEYIE